MALEHLVAYWSIAHKSYELLLYFYHNCFCAFGGWQTLVKI